MTNRTFKDRARSLQAGFADLMQKRHKASVSLCQAMDLLAAADGFRNRAAAIAADEAKAATPAPAAGQTTAEQAVAALNAGDAEAKAHLDDLFQAEPWDGVVLAQGHEDDRVCVVYFADRSLLAIDDDRTRAYVLASTHANDQGEDDEGATPDSDDTTDATDAKESGEGELRTSREWLETPEFGDVTIMDYDGWDRRNLEASLDEPITLDEFTGRLRRSTSMRAQPRGLFAQLTPDQQKAALAYRGEANHGDPAFLRTATATITQTDREEAASKIVGDDAKSKAVRLRIIDGLADDHPGVQAAAFYRKPPTRD